ncbi:ATP-binding cassette domain-containing protein [Desulfobacter hydrogenophilus]|uniref:ATP-binding cassette domain-containing protein n=1 Tax=Desulfobacter hydrogenophilus TaxID=2291 RepID=UPI0020115163|nr:ATP-binding cassette domain-containing protein [Desulfobacter hydrogenophilus]
MACLFIRLLRCVNGYIYLICSHCHGPADLSLAGGIADFCPGLSPACRALRHGCGHQCVESAMVPCMVVLGGMGSIPGVILGVIALIALPEAFRQFESYRMLIFGLKKRRDRPMSEQPILEMKNVHAGYGSIKALEGVSIKVMPGEIVTMIGANGAGKSTTLMTICGIVKASAYISRRCKKQQLLK